MLNCSWMPVRREPFAAVVARTTTAGRLDVNRELREVPFRGASENVAVTMLLALRSGRVPLAPIDAAADLGTIAGRQLDHRRRRGHAH